MKQMDDAEALKFIEDERKQLEVRLLAITGLHVDVTCGIFGTRKGSEHNERLQQVAVEQLGWARTTLANGQTFVASPNVDSSVGDTTIYWRPKEAKHVQ